MTSSEFEKFLARMNGPAIVSILLIKTALHLRQSMSQKESTSATHAEPEGVLTVCCEGCGLQTHHLIQISKK